MELQGAHEAGNYQRREFAKTSFQDNDEQQHDVLVRLGKLPILKVGSFPPISRAKRVKLILIAQFWFHVHCGLYMYHLDHMGSCLHVRGRD